MPAELAEELVRRALRSPAALGSGRLLCIDGPAGSGKTTLAAAVATQEPPDVDVSVLHMDDVYPGWDGLEEGVERVSRLVVAPLTRGLPGGYRRYDWRAGDEAEWVEVPACDLLVIEGVGSGSVEPRSCVSLLVWVDAARELRLQRWGDREGGRDRWSAWAAAEAEHHARHRTRERADVLVDGGTWQVSRAADA